MSEKIVNIGEYIHINNTDYLLDDRIEKLILNIKKSQNPESTMLIDRSITHLNFLKDILKDLPRDYYNFQILGEPESSGYTSIYIEVKNTGQKKLLYSEDYNVKEGTILDEDLFKTKDLMAEYIKRQIDGFEEERKRFEYINRNKNSDENLAKGDDIYKMENKKVA